MLKKAGRGSRPLRGSRRGRRDQALHRAHGPPRRAGGRARGCGGAGAHPVVFPPLRRPPAECRRARALRPLPVQPGRGRARARQLRGAPHQVLVLGGRDRAALTLRDPRPRLQAGRRPRLQDRRFARRCLRRGRDPGGPLSVSGRGSAEEGAEVAAGAASSGSRWGRFFAHKCAEKQDPGNLSTIYPFTVRRRGGSE